MELWLDYFFLKNLGLPPVVTGISALSTATSLKNTEVLPWRGNITREELTMGSIYKEVGGGSVWKPKVGVKTRMARWGWMIRTWRDEEAPNEARDDQTQSDRLDPHQTRISSTFYFLLLILHYHVSRDIYHLISSNIICYLLPAICHLLSAICYLLSAICYLLLGMARGDTH